MSINNLRAATAKNPYRAILSGYLVPFWRRALLLLILLLAGAGLLLLIPRILAAFIDAALQGSASASLLGLGALFLGIALGNQAITIVTNYLGADIGLRATNQLRADLTLHCLQLDMAFHHSTTPGILIERIDGDVTRLNQFLSTFAVLLLKNALLIVGALAALFAVDWRVGAVITAFVLLTLGLLEVSRRAAVPSNRHEREASAQLFGLVEERLSGTEDVRANGGVAYVMRRFTERSRDWAQAFLRAHTLSAITWPLTSILFAGGLALSLGLAAWLLPIGVISIGAAYAIYRYVELMREPIRQIGRQVQDLQQAGAAIVRVQELLAQRSAIHDHGTATLPAQALDVAFHGVTFAYPTADESSSTAAPPRSPSAFTRSPSALQDLSFHLPAGQVLGLLGRSGSGKTTLARLLFRLYEPVQGTILLNDLALPAVSLAALRERVGLVTQDVQLFNASVRDNLALFEPDIADVRLLAALSAVELSDWYEALPQGLDNVLPAGGGGMSAGQAQLLAFARMLLKDPGLVILDEASSRLDPITEQRLDHALDRLLAGRTAIIIAHRLATVQRADWIMILDGGRCVEFGPRVALMSDPNSQFARLLRVGLEEVLA